MSTLTVNFSHQADWQCGPYCEAPEDTVMTCDDCKMGLQARKDNQCYFRLKSRNQFQADIDQLLATETLDAIVEFLSGDFCASLGDDRCPEALDVVIRQGLPMLAAAGADGDFSEVPPYNFKVLIFFTLCC